MRHETYRMTDDEAVALFETADVVRIAAVRPDGDPIFRAVHGVVVGDRLAFHASPKGEKSSMARWPCVVSAERIVARIPSHFVDPERACPATTYYLSAQAKGAFVEVIDPERKALVLQRLMERFQPEGRYAPIRHDDPRYQNAVKGIAVFELPLDRVTGKKKLGQNRSKAEIERILEALWERGDRADVEAIGLVMGAHPESPLPAFLRAEDGVELVPQVGEADLPRTVDLLEHQYWNTGVSREEIARAHRRSTAWVGAKKDGMLIATARAVSDATRHAWIYDVAVDDRAKGRGIGARMMKLLLDHPSVRRASKIHLATRDAQSFYARFGFVERAVVGGSIFMTRERASAASLSLA